MSRFYESLARAAAVLGVLAMAVGLMTVPQATAASPNSASTYDCSANCAGCSLLAPCGSSNGTCTGTDCTSGCICGVVKDTLTGQSTCVNACQFKYPILID